MQNRFEVRANKMLSKERSKAGEVGVKRILFFFSFNIQR